jgi:hypothetical protein
MRSYIINILFQSEDRAKLALESYESNIAQHKDYLESALSITFGFIAHEGKPEISIGSINRMTNELEIGSYGSKYPSFELGDSLKNLVIDGLHAIKLETIHDDGGKKRYHFVNGRKCTKSKFDSFYDDVKVKDSTTESLDTKKPIASKRKSQRKIQKPKATLVFDYGKERDCETAIIRVQIRRKLQRTKIRGLLENTLASDDRVSHFSKGFDPLVASETYEIRWCKLRAENSERWLASSENLISGLIFVLEQDSYLYLGFDLEGIDLNEECPIDQNLRRLILIFNSIDGVNKVWIKCRPGKKTITERYLYYPDAGRGPEVSRRDLTNDNEWPK